MLRLHRSRPARPSTKVEFGFSDFRAVRVPKGWDRLFISVVSAGTGKTLAKLSKAAVKNGICQWTETLQESMPVSMNESSKEFEDCVVKIVVATGMARSGVLGEAAVNMTNYMDSSDVVPISLPLKKCNFGTVLQVKIQRLTPSTKLRDDKVSDKSSGTENSNLGLDSAEGDVNSEGSEGSLRRKALGSTSRAQELFNQESSHSFCSPEVTPGIDERSPIVDDDDDSLARDPMNSDQQSFVSQSESADSTTSVSVDRRDIMMQQMTLPSSSKSLLQAAEDTILELRAESKMWERTAQKLMLDLEMLRTELSDESKNRADLDVQLSAANTELDSLKRQVERLRQSLEQLPALDDLESRNGGSARIVKELEEEIRFQKESNADLAMQLSRSQESNIELVAVLQELEETAEKQKLEIENHRMMQTKFSEMENDMLRNEMENKSLQIQLQEIRESEGELRSRLQELEQAPKNERTMMKHKSDLKEITKEANDMVEERVSEEKTNESVENLNREIETLREKVRELEEDCNELTEENLNLLIKLKEAASASPQGGAPVEFSFNDYGERALSESADSNESADNHEEEAARGHETMDKVIKKDARNDAAIENGQGMWTELEEKLHLKDQEINHLTECKFKLEAMVSELEKEKMKMRENLDIMRREGEITARCLQEMQNDMAALSKSVHFHVSANRSLERRSSELEAGKAELEGHLVELRDEKERMHLRLLEAESKMEQISDEKASSEAELKELKGQGSRLEDEISGLVHELIKVEEERKLELIEMQNNMEELRNNVDSHVSANDRLERRSIELEAEKTKFQEQATKLQEEVQCLRHHSTELESEIIHLSLKKDSDQMELQRLETRCLDLENEILRLNDELDKHDEDWRGELLEMQKEMTELSNSIDTHVSVYKTMEKRYSELEAAKAKLEQRVVGLEGDKECLHFQLSGLERETGRLSDEKLSSQIQLQELKKKCSSLEDDLSRLNAELDKTNEEQNQEQLASRIQLNEALEECDSLRNSKLGLELAVERLVEGQRSLEKLNNDLRRQKQDLHNQCLQLEEELEQLRGSYDGQATKIEEMEGKISVMLDNVAAKERSLRGELNILVLENEKQREELVLVHKSYEERMADICGLKADINLLTDQVIVLRGERDGVVSEKCSLEVAVRETQDELKSKEAELNNLRTEVEDLKMMKLAEGKLSRQLEFQKSREQKMRTALNELELKLTVSEYERRQLAEELGRGKIQMLKIENLQEQIADLKKELNAAKAEKEKTEALLISVSSECKQLRTEKNTQEERIKALHDSLAELDNLKQGRMELEEKLLRAENDVAMKEELCAEAIDTRNELNRVRRENRQYRRATQQLEEEKEQAVKRAKALEDELTAIKEEKRNQRDPRIYGMPKAGRRTVPPNDHAAGTPDESFHSGNIDARSRTSFQNTDFPLPAESDPRGHTSDAPRKPAKGGDVAPKERYERTKSSLESELRDIRERYLIMSLKYAEVEAQREELVMKLKANKNKRWFS
ncbi:hypothetical protein MLD38_016146 [Melastoma candidum]|uniref:Uncharacterized protein n=1 Tax=Melastoma candidum TaxID=119954 RepID=A0ACB9RIL9_9MYRT|nr:hypothetical protein MLD38_016146 [Melastoma candidum]